MSSIIRVNDTQDAGGNSIISSNGSGTFSNNLGITGDFVKLLQTSKHIMKKSLNTFQKLS